MAKNLLTVIDQAVAALLAARKELSTTKQTAAKPSAKKTSTLSSPAKRGMSEEGRQRIAEAQRKRWAAQKKAARKAARATA